MCLIPIIVIHRSRYLLWAEKEAKGFEFTVQIPPPSPPLGAPRGEEKKICASRLCGPTLVVSENNSTV